MALHAASGEAAFKRGNEAYEKDQFEEARGAYRAAVDGGWLADHAFYHLGNAEYRLGHPGAAAWAYERALAITPGHPEARANLEFVRRKAGSEIAPIRMEWMLRTGSAAVWMLSAVVAFWVLLVWSLWSRRLSKGLITGVGLLMAFAAGRAVVQLHAGTRWVVTGEKVSARVAPASIAASAAALTPGSVCHWIETRGDWIYAELPKGGRGWVARKDIAPIVPEV